ncbi:carboxymethylenebutenolidase [Duganella sp. CF517]|uniref:dienelactone hydrolase family protein n=1 Tax=Duganella sp. CF517 TaxID=1881038 RepID=UPI0008C8BB6C|nr:dienelactone hydrolase family protein [Duganella sp. CF517]SEN69452.1 carboxymethylenebutenolidase [Duganella sp. CF517]
MNASSNESLTVTVAEGSFQCYVARPAGSGGAPATPVIVVLQEIFGVNAGIRSICDDYAAKGYIAVAPDLFWRAAPGLDMSEANPGDWERGFALYGAYDFGAGVGDVAATVAAARAMQGASGKVGVTGYCLGGLMTFLTAARADADAFVAYYGGATENYAAEGAGVKRPLLYHLAGDDEYIGKDAQAVIHAALKDNANIEMHTYPGCNHAFARPGGDHYDAAAATLANGRTDAFFTRHLN